MAYEYMMALGAFMAVMLAAAGAYFLFASRKTALDVRLEEIAKGASPEKPAGEATGKSGWAGFAARIGGVVPISEKVSWKLEGMMVQAGFRRGRALLIFVGFKVILGAAGSVLVFAYALAALRKPMPAVLLAGAAFMMLYILPNVWLNEKVKKRKQEIFHSLPDVLDLMTVCVEAGLGLDAAMIKITEEKQFKNQILANEFRQASQEIRAGKKRIDALRDIAERTGVDDIKALVALLVQTEKLGASLSRSLRVHSDSLRVRRRQIAEEAAAKTSVKLLFPLALFIFPALMVVLLGPAVIRIFDTLLHIHK
jgi:tight adherence protein C